MLNNFVNGMPGEGIKKEAGIEIQPRVKSNIL